MRCRKQAKPSRCNSPKLFSTIPAAIETTTLKHCIKSDPDTNLIIECKRPRRDVKTEGPDFAYPKTPTKSVKVKPDSSDCLNKCQKRTRAYVSEIQSNSSKCHPIGNGNLDGCALDRLSAQVCRMGKETLKWESGPSTSIIRRTSCDRQKETRVVATASKFSAKGDRKGSTFHESNAHCRSNQFTGADILCSAASLSSRGALGALSQFVERVGASVEMPSATNQQRISPASCDKRLSNTHDDVLRCIVCTKQCASLDALVQHKRQTGHFRDNFATLPRIVPSHAATSLNSKIPVTAQGSNISAHTLQRCFEQLLTAMRQAPMSPSVGRSVANLIGRRGRFGFRCNLCGFTSMSGSVDVHMTSAHSFRSAAEWKEAVALIPVHK